MAISSVKLGENAAPMPPHINTRTATPKVCRRPKRASNHGVKRWAGREASMKAEATHCALSRPMPKCWVISGTATLAMVEAMNEDMLPAMTVTSSSHL